MIGMSQSEMTPSGSGEGVIDRGSRLERTARSAYLSIALVVSVITWLGLYLTRSSHNPNIDDYLYTAKAYGLGHLLVSSPGNGLDDVLHSGRTRATRPSCGCGALPSGRSTGSCRSRGCLSDPSRYRCLLAPASLARPGRVQCNRARCRSESSRPRLVFDAQMRSCSDNRHRLDIRFVLELRPSSEARVDRGCGNFRGPPPLSRSLALATRSRWPW